MKNNVLIKTIQTAFTICPWDCVFMIAFQLSMALMPTVILLCNQLLIRSMSESGTLYITFTFLLFYCLTLFLQRALINWYNRYYVTYNSLLRFEKKIKFILFDICNKMKLNDYNDPKIVNSTLRAKNASINIMRVYQAIGEMLSAIIGVLSLSIILSTINWIMATIILLFAFSSIAENLFTIFQNKKLLYENTQIEKEETEYGDFLLAPNKLKETKTLRCVSFVFTKWEQSFKRLNDMESKKNKRVFYFSLCIAIVSMICQIGAYGVLFTAYSNKVIGIAEFSVSIVAFNSLNGLVKNMFDVLGGVGQFLVMVQPYFYFVDLVAQREMKPIKEENKENISYQLNHVCYQYPNMEEYALKDISLDIGSGQKIAIVGQNGSGKTTLLHLILNMFEPTSGSSCFGGINSSKISDEMFLKYVSVVPQQHNCYAVSIKDNIAFGSTITDQALKDMLEHVYLSNLETDTIIGRNFGGIELSGGQKQRIAILRAKYKQANIIALDEPTSAVDPFQEKDIYDQLLTMMQGKTAIVISHRLLLSKACDKIVVLKNGKIIEEGTHDALLKLDGLYAGMWKIQSNLYS